MSRCKMQCIDAYIVCIDPCCYVSMQVRFSNKINMLCVDAKSVWVDSYWSKMVFVSLVIVWVDAMLFVSIQNHIMSKNTFWSIQSMLYLYHVMHTFILNTMRYIYHTYLQSYKTLQRKRLLTNSPFLMMANCKMCDDWALVKHSPWVCAWLN